MDDHALLREFAEVGSEPAFRQLVERHVNLVYSTARRRVGDVHRAQDVAQQVFVLLTRKASRLPPRVMLAGWLYRTTCHVASELRRRETRHQHRVQQAVAAMNTESSDMPDTVVDRRTQTFVVSTRNAGATNLKLLRPDLFEVTYRGALEQAPDPARTIIIREKEPFPALAQGGLMRTYIFADGHTEIYRAPEGNFTAWERERGLTATP